MLDTWLHYDDDDDNMWNFANFIQFYADMTGTKIKELYGYPTEAYEAIAQWGWEGITDRTPPHADKLDEDESDDEY